MTSEINLIFLALSKMRQTNPAEADKVAEFIASLSNEFRSMSELIDGMREQQEAFELSTKSGIISQSGEILDLKKRVTELERACTTAAFAVANRLPELALAAIQQAVPGVDGVRAPSPAKAKPENISKS